MLGLKITDGDLHEIGVFEGDTVLYKQDFNKQNIDGSLFIISISGGKEKARFVEYYSEDLFSVSTSQYDEPELLICADELKILGKVVQLHREVA